METLCNGADSWGYSEHSWSQNIPMDAVRTSMCANSHYDLHTVAMTSTPGYYGHQHQHQRMCGSPTDNSTQGMQLPVQLPCSTDTMDSSQLALHVWEQYRRSQMLRGQFLHQHPHHHPHPHTIARRNERERNRVKTINSTFSKLRQHLPCSSKTKKLSKVQILRSAIQYINQLSAILKAQEEEGGKEAGQEMHKDSNSRVSECDDTVSLVSSSTSCNALQQLEQDEVAEDDDDDDDEGDDDLENFSSWLQ